MKKFTLLAFAAFFSLTVSAHSAVQPQSGQKKAVTETWANHDAMRAQTAANAAEPIGGGILTP